MLTKIYLLCFILLQFTESRLYFQKRFHTLMVVRYFEQEEREIKRDVYRFWYLVLEHTIQVSLIQYLIGMYSIILIYQVTS